MRKKAEETKQTGGIDVTSTKDNLETLPFESIDKVNWVIVTYEEEYFVGKVESKVHDGCDTHKKCAKVRCFQKPYGIPGYQEFEHEHAVICYDTFYVRPVCPHWTPDGQSWKYTY